MAGLMCLTSRSTSLVRAFIMLKHLNIMSKITPRSTMSAAASTALSSAPRPAVPSLTTRAKSQPYCLTVSSRWTRSVLTLVAPVLTTCARTIRPTGSIWMATTVRLISTIAGAASTGPPRPTTVPRPTRPVVAVGAELIHPDLSPSVCLQRVR